MEESGTKTVLKIEPKSILVYTPSCPISVKRSEEIYDGLQSELCIALNYTPNALPVGIVILHPGDKLELLNPNKTLGEITEERAKRDNAANEIAGSEE